MLSTGLLLLLSFLFLPSAQAQILEEQQRLIYEFEGFSDNFGRSLTMSETTLVVGDVNHRLNVYGKEEGDDEWVYKQAIPPPTDTGFDYTNFGRVFAVSGDTIAVLVSKEEWDAPIDNYVLLFGWNGSDWVYTQTVPVVLSARDLVLTDSSLAFVSGGELHVLPKTGAGLVDASSEQIVLAEDSPETSFGSITAQDDFLFVSADDGSLYAFKKKRDGVYKQEQKLTRAEEGFRFFSHLSSHGTTLAVFGWEDDELDPWTAHVRLYSFETGTLVLQGSVGVDEGGWYSVRDVVVASDGLLLVLHRDDRSTGVYLTIFGLDGDTFGDNGRTHTPFDDGITGLRFEGAIAATDDSIAFAYGNYNDGEDGVIQLFHRPSSSRIRKFVLFSTDKDTRVSPSLEDGAVYDRKEIGRALNIKAVTDGPVDSVVFELNGYEYSTDEAFPYMLRDGDPKDHRRVPELAFGGTFTLTATPYSGPGGTGRVGSSSTVTFTLN